MWDEPTAAEIYAALGDLPRDQSIEIESHMSARLIHPNMPKPSDGLEIVVCGAARGICVQNQYELLRDQGYKVKINEDLCVY